MTRISILTADEMSAEQRAAIEASKASRSPQGGPFWAYIRHPKLMRGVQDARASINESTLSPRELIIVTLVVARFWNSSYPWAAQCINAVKIGLSQSEIDAINTRSPLPVADKRELLAHQITGELLTDKRLGDATYAAAQAAFSIEEIVALVARVGLFSMMCTTSNAFDIQPPDDIPYRLKA